MSVQGVPTFLFIVFVPRVFECRRGIKDATSPSRQIAQGFYVIIIVIITAAAAAGPSPGPKSSDSGRSRRVSAFLLSQCRYIRRPVGGGV